MWQLLESSDRCGQFILSHEQAAAGLQIQWPPRSESPDYKSCEPGEFFHPTPSALLVTSPLFIHYCDRR